VMSAVWEERKNRKRASASASDAKRTFHRSGRLTRVLLVALFKASLPSFCLVGFFEFVEAIRNALRLFRRATHSRFSDRVKADQADQAYQTPHNKLVEAKHLFSS
jgi:hypothetical protein